MIRSMLRFLQVLVAGLLVAVLTGCFEVREHLKIEPDESGTYTMTIAMDMSGMLELAGPPGSEERKAAVARMAEEGGDPMEAQGELPEGITYNGGGTRMEGEKMVVEVSFGFATLEALQTPMKVFDHVSAGDQGPLAKAKDDEPQPLVRVPMTRKGKKVTFKGKLYDDPPEDLPEVPDGDEAEDVPPELKGMMDALKDIQFVYEIETVKHKVKSHDADEVDGNVLRWTNGLKDLKDGATIDVTLSR